MVCCIGDVCEEGSWVGPHRGANGHTGYNDACLPGLVVTGLGIHIGTPFLRGVSETEGGLLYMSSVVYVVYIIFA